MTGIPSYYGAALHLAQTNKQTVPPEKKGLDNGNYNLDAEVKGIFSNSCISSQQLSPNDSHSKVFWGKPFKPTQNQIVTLNCSTELPCPFKSQRKIYLKRRPMEKLTQKEEIDLLCLRIQGIAEEKLPTKFQNYLESLYGRMDEMSERRWEEPEFVTWMENKGGLEAAIPYYDSYDPSQAWLEYLSEQGRNLVDQIHRSPSPTSSALFFKHFKQLRLEFLRLISISVDGDGEKCKKDI